MSLRTRLTIFVLLFGAVVATNLLALLYLARSVSASLETTERIRQRQLLAVQMVAHLRDAESALYRYQIIGEAGFKTQFEEQLGNFEADLEQFIWLAATPEEVGWYTLLQSSHRQALRTGSELIALRDQLDEDLQTYLESQSRLTELLLGRARAVRPDDTPYQSSVAAMQDASRAMLSAVSGYLAAPQETNRVRFTDAAVNFRRASGEYASLAQTAEAARLQTEILALFDQMQMLGSRLISQRDLQQSQYANFIAITHNAGQQIIVGKIEPHETANFAREQQNLLRAVNTAILVSVLITVLLSSFTIVLMVYLTRQINIRVNALLRGAERVAGGNLAHPVGIAGTDEFGRLAASFDHMMAELASREERLRSLISKMAQIQDEERRLIGLDLHDGLTQLIISANMHLNTLNALLGSRLDSEAKQELDVGRTLVRQSIDEARKVIAELRPTVIEDFGLKEGLRRYLADICDTHKWTCEILIDLEGLEVKPPIDAAIFRIVQEAISNIRKHAQTSRVKLVLKTQEHSLFLQVQDWGRGFDPRAFEDDLSHLGLVSMQERAQMLGGSFQIDSKIGEGTSITVTIPLAALAERSGNVAK